MMRPRDLIDNHWAEQERQALCDLLLEYGPDAPTLCGTWNTRDLAGHLVAREARPDAALGIGFSPLSNWTSKVEHDYAQRPFVELVEAIRTGPPIWSPFKIPTVDRLANTEEYFVHLEDISRAQDAWEPRELDPEFANFLWQLTKQRSRFLFRRSPVGVQLIRTDQELAQTQAKKPNLQNGLGSVTISGAAQELVLYSFGRKAQSDVLIEGDPRTIEVFGSTNLSV